MRVPVYMGWGVRAARCGWMCLEPGGGMCGGWSGAVVEVAGSVGGC